MTLLVLLALLVSTPDGLPPKASPAPPVVTPPRPAAAPKVETSDRKPAVGASAIAPGPCGAERCLCKHGCEPGKCVGGCEGRGAPLPATDGDFRPTPAAPAASFTIFGPDGKPLFGNAYVPPTPAAPPDDRQWYALGGQYAGYYGYGRKLPNGAIAVDWSCRAGATDVRRGLPALQPSPAYTLPPQAFGTCPGGQCPAPTYTYRRGFFGTR